VKERKTKKLTCIVTGRPLLATREYYDRKIKKCGGEEKLQKTYVCKEVKNLLLKGYNVEKIRKMLNVNIETLDDVSESVINDILNSGRTRFRRINNITTVSNILNPKTDPEVKKFIEHILKDGK
tara:strand:- start:56 stop:427 length:372 start_codon:yes stop_codon:yes gene_type:complete